MSEVVVVRRTLESVQRAQSELAAIPELRWAGGTQSLSQAAELIRLHKPQLLLCDLRLVGGNAMHLLKSLHKAPVADAAPPRVLLLTPSADDQLLFQALCAGADGYALDAGDPEQLQHAAIDFLTGQAPMSPMIARQMLACFGEPRTPLHRASQPPGWPFIAPVRSGALAESERSLLSLLAHGLLAGEIARCWGQALEQVARQIAGLYRKLHAAAPCPVTV